MKTITISDETYSKPQGDIEKLEKQTKGILTKVATYKVDATEEYLTTDCFKSKDIYYRDNDFDNYLKNEMPTIGGGRFSVYSWERSITSKQMVQAFLETKEENLDTLALLLIAGGHTFSLKQMEDILDRTGKGEGLGLVTDGWANLFPVHDSEGRLFFAYVYRVDDLRWDAFVDRFGSENVWHAGRRVSFRN